MESIERMCGAWKLDGELVRRLQPALAQAEQETGLEWNILSGYRTEEEQDQLRRQGRPTAPPGCSTHTVCPATGADVQVSTFPTNAIKATWGRIVVMHGMRWGGGSPVDPNTGIPSDWNHVDLGPRC